MIDLSSARTPPQMTPEILFLKGRLSLWQYSIPFFTANVPLKYAADNFKLFEDLPQADTGEWTLEELFQRDISWSRVEGDILQYLKNPSRPQFFNALTVALLPSGTVDFGQPHGEALKLRAIEDPNLGAPVGVGGVQIQYFGSDEDVENGPGMLRWSTAHVDAVAVDGQHRLAAIKRFVQQTRKEVWSDASVPVIFVVADARVGFRTPQAAGEEMRTTGALRALFIDLNKNARSVSPTRNILLDDLDVVSVATRSLVGGSLSVRETDVERVPLSLVDWLSDRNKIEDGPFITTIMLLQEAVTRLLDVPDPRLDEEDDSIAKVGAWLDRALPTADAPERETIMQQVRACAVQQSKLTWLPEHMAILRRGFERQWRPHMHRLFRSFAPYSDLWEYSAANDLLEPRFVNLYVAREVMADAAGERRERRLVDAATADVPGWTLEKRFERPLRHIEREIKRQSWAYKVVFQRALLRAFVDLLRNPVPILGRDVDRGELTELFVKAMNALVEVGAIEVDYAHKKGKSFWTGSGLTAEGTIEFTNAGAERLRAWLLGFVKMSAPGVRTPTFAQLETSDIVFLRKTFRTTNSPIYKGMAKLAAARGMDHEDEDVVFGLVRERYDHMRSLVKA